MLTFALCKTSWKRSAEKYSLLGQDLETYLEGLLYSRSLTYWDYIELDTLLTLQKPRTDFPDEQIFIVYHQITELYFKLVKIELELLAQESWQEERPLLKRLRRIESYFRHLTHSFEIMLYGMDSEHFLRFRTALLPASGFQSVQFREIELMSTGLRQLLAPHRRDVHTEDVNELYANIYWKFGNLDARTGEKTLTLKLFERKYDEHLRKMAWEWKDRNLNARLEAALAKGQVSEALLQLFREVDVQINIHWRLVHLRTAAALPPKEMRAPCLPRAAPIGSGICPYYQRDPVFPQPLEPRGKAGLGQSRLSGAL